MRAIVDTHAHLCDPVFDNDLPQVLHRAGSAGVQAVIAVGENMDGAVKNLALAARHPAIRAAAGLYPTVLDLNLAAQMRDFIRAHRDQLAAIGEVGLDYWVVKNEPDQEIQREILRGFVELSNETGLPLTE